MRISLKVSADLEFVEAGPIFHADIQADIDGEGAEVIELEKLGNEHQRQMARDAHDLFEKVGPFIMQIIAGANGRPMDRPDPDPEGLNVPGYGRELLEHAARLNRLEQVVDGHGLAGMSERIGFLASGLKLLEGQLPPAGWTTPTLVNESKGLTLCRVARNDGTWGWRIYDYDGNVRAEGATIHDAAADLVE